MVYELPGKKSQFSIKNIFICQDYNMSPFLPAK